MEDDEGAIKSLVIEAVKECDDVELLDLIYKLLASNQQ